MLGLTVTAGLLASAHTAPPQRRKHVLMILADDYGWGDSGWHRQDDIGRQEVLTPTMDGLIKQGLELDRHYTYKFCSPTRSALQSGRNPIHVNVQNLDPLNHNPADPVSGFSAIPRNMTGIATVMAGAGYRTAMAGKWDGGMATPSHTPHGRGYEDSLLYFHHMNDYFDSTYENPSGVCDGMRPVDLWMSRSSDGYEGPAHGVNNPEAHCNLGAPSDLGSAPEFCDYHNESTCKAYPGYPGDELTGCIYEDQLFKQQVIEAVQKQDPRPLFFFWALHIVHAPLQVPKVNLDRFAGVKDWRRRRYLAMVNYTPLCLCLSVCLCVSVSL